MNGHWSQRYEYVLTKEGVDYGKSIARYYPKYMKQISDYLDRHKHEIPRDMVYIDSERYNR